MVRGDLGFMYEENDNRIYIVTMITILEYIGNE